MWDGYEGGYDEVRYTVPTQGTRTVTFTVPAEMRGARFLAASFTCSVSAPGGIRHIRYSGTQLEVTDAGLLERLQRGDSEISVTFSFRASAGGGEGSHSAYCTWSNITVICEYSAQTTAAGAFSAQGAGTVSYSFSARSLCPGEHADARFSFTPSMDIYGLTLEMSDSSGTARETFAYTGEMRAGETAFISLGVSLSDAWWTGRVASAYIRVSLTDAGGSVSGSWLLTELKMCSARLAPTVSCTWTDAGEAYTLTGAFVQGKSLLACALSYTADTEADDCIALSARRLTFAGREYLSGTDGFEPFVCDASGDIPYTLTVTDVYGREGACSGTLHLTPYAPPRLTELEFQRYSAHVGDGGATYYEPDDGSRLIRVSVRGSVSPVNGHNAWELSASYTDGVNGGQAVLAADTDGRALIYENDRTLFTVLLDETSAWDISVTLTDVFGSAVYDAEVPKAGGIFSIERGGVAVGMRSAGTRAFPLFEVNYPALFYAGAEFPGSDTQWQEVQLTGCSEYSQDYPVRCRVRLGTLYLRGAMKLAQSLSNGSERLLFTLPQGCAPAYAYCVSTGQSGGACLLIGTDGSVKLLNRTGGTLGTSAFVSLTCALCTD